MSELIDIIISKQARQELQATIADLEKADLTVIKSIESANKLSNAYRGIKSPSELVSTMKQY